MNIPKQLDFNFAWIVSTSLEQASRIALEKVALYNESMPANFASSNRNIKDKID